MKLPHFSLLKISTLLAAGLILHGCKRPAPPVVAPVPVYVATVLQHNVPLTRSAVGLVQPLHTVAMQSQVDGVIAKVHFNEGDEVASGTLLITLDQRPFQNALISAKAELAQAHATEARAKADAERYARLHGEQAISEAEFSQYTTAAAAASAAVAVQEAAVANAQLNLDYTEIRAPVAGRTSRLALREGALVRANDSAQSLLVLNQMAPIGVAFSVPESSLAAVRVAFGKGAVTVTAQAQGDAALSIAGKLDYIDNTVGMNTGTVALRASFDNTDRTLWPGQFVSVTLLLGELPDALVVPNTAIVAGQTGNQIFIVKADKTIEVRPVHTGVIDGDNTVALDAVQAGETVVIDGQLRLVPGTHVTIRTRDGKTETTGSSATSSR